MIRRCLDSVRALIDCWVIVDTGSTDGTQELIREHLRRPARRAARAAVGRLRAQPLRGHRARARPGRLPADHRRRRNAGEPATASELPRLSADSNYSRSAADALLARASSCCAVPWPGASKASCTNTPIAPRPGARSSCRICGSRRTATARGPATADLPSRRARYSRGALREEPDNARYVFYLAQTYSLINDFDSALQHYRRRVELGGRNEEVWYSLYRIAQLEQARSTPWQEVMEHYLAAYEFMPDRAGPLFHIGMNYQGKGDYHTAHLFFSRAMRIPHPGHDRLFVERHLYEYLLPLEHAVACHYVGECATAIATYNRLLRQDKVPPALVDQVIANRRWSIDALAPKTQAPTQAPTEVATIRICVPFRDPGPELDECVESILRQDLDLFVAVFIDDGSSHDHAVRIPMEDPRFCLVRHEKPIGREACVDRFVHGRCGADDLVVPLRAE